MAIQTVLVKLDNRWDRSRIGERRIPLQPDGRSLLVEPGYTPRPRAGLTSSWQRRGEPQNGLQLWVAL